ncbi:hypothetical protein BDM02DRAFT_3122380 [Thelephora ganbajun]|uniref:Uncharacterized protein n=1 Tax=Thelephora ganbajun TaxID=370292 RepID=A0ACB6Z4A6_THEGA|nr:hypothetical protein BDM02DRAFT_3122380 [Thelephora ganbajun]
MSKSVPVGFGAAGPSLWFLLATRTKMKRLFDKKPKKSPKPSPKHISPQISTNVVAKTLGFRAELDIGPDDERSNSGEDKQLPAPEASASGIVVVGTDHGSDPTSKCF